MGITFHYIVRGVVGVDGRVLLCREVGAENTFLPGGHIEAGERAVDALAREVEEETGLRPVVGAFLGAVEAGWTDAQGDHHEVNLLFEAALPGADGVTAPASREAHLEFLWGDRAALSDLCLMPAPLVDCLATWPPVRGFWGSAL